MKQPERIHIFLQQIRIFPLSWLNFSLSKRVLIVAFSYLVGIIGLWSLFPLTHNGATMYLPIVSACWLFRYRGMFVSLILNGIAFQLIYVFLLRYMLPDQDFINGGVIGFGTSLMLGIIICWLRIAVDQLYAARQRTLAAEKAHLQATQAEQQVTLAYEQQRKINELKDQFLLNVSHELRTPLTVLGGSLELLTEYHEHLDPPKRTQLLKQAMASQKELVDLVNHVLDAATVVGEIPLAQCKTVNLHQTIQEVLAHLAPEDVQAYTICLRVPREINIWADPQFLRQILINILSNVFKYVPTQTKIQIEAIQTDPSSRVYLSIQDAGPGIPPDELPLLFEKFVRLKRNMASTTRGTGLGLYICKHLVEAMEGRIWVESSGRIGEGSRFYVTLPTSLTLALPEPELSHQQRSMIINGQ